MIRFSSRVAACSSLLVLAACGGGGGGGSTGGGERFSLDTPGDALRELSLAGLVASDIPDGQPEAAAAPAAKRIGGSGRWGNPVLPDRSVRLAKASCTLGGESNVVQNDEKTRNFMAFGESVAVDFKVQVDSACIVAASPQPDPPRTATERFNGRFETGDSGTRGDGSRLAYLIDGSSSAPYVIRYQEIDNGQVVYEEFEGSLGTVESRLAQDGALDLRADYDYSFDASDRFDSYSKLVQLGSGLAAPYRAFRDGDELTLSGRYVYDTSECVGGTVTVSTEQTLRLNGNDYPVAGRLRLASGNQFAVFTFNPDGTADLNLNGQAQPRLTRDQVEDAIDDEPC